LTDRKANIQTRALITAMSNCRFSRTFLGPGLAVIRPIISVWSCSNW